MSSLVKECFPEHLFPQPFEVYSKLERKLGEREGGGRISTYCKNNFSYIPFS